MHAKLILPAVLQTSILLCLLLLLSGIKPPVAEAGDWSGYAYGGKWSDNLWNEIIRGDTQMRGSYLWVAGASRKLHDYGDHLRVEGELNVAKHSGMQNHLELNTAALLRLRAFPWSRYVATSIAYGLGLSHAFDRPPIEEEPDRGAVRTLLSMPTEVTIGPPDADWEIMFRIHHRSGAFGIFKDAGGSNFISLGLRFELGGAR
ncbi:MAG: hypothetical protein R6W72_08535 [Desulfurivibrionaceae bacterium]